MYSNQAPNWCCPLWSRTDMIVFSLFFFFSINWWFPLFFLLFFFRNWKKGRLKGKKSSLLSVIFCTFWKEYLKLSLMNFGSDIILRLGQPILLSYLLKYFRFERRKKANRILDAKIYPYLYFFSEEAQKLRIKRH